MLHCDSQLSLPHGGGITQLLPVLRITWCTGCMAHVSQLEGTAVHAEANKEPMQHIQLHNGQPSAQLGPL